MATRTPHRRGRAVPSSRTAFDRSSAWVRLPRRLRRRSRQQRLRQEQRKGNAEGYPLAIAARSKTTDASRPIPAQANR